MSKESSEYSKWLWSIVGIIASLYFMASFEDKDRGFMIVMGIWLAGMIIWSYGFTAGKNDKD